jgi:hypothetical protein
MGWHRSVIIHDLHINGITPLIERVRLVLGCFGFPAKANPPLLVDPETILSGAITTQRLESIARTGLKLPQRFRCIKRIKPTSGLIRESLKWTDSAARNECQCIFADS